MEWFICIDLSMPCLQWHMFAFCPFITCDYADFTMFLPWNMRHLQKGVFLARISHHISAMNRPAVCHLHFWLHVHKPPGRSLTSTFAGVSVHTAACYPPSMTVYVCVCDRGEGGIPLWSKQNLILYFPVEFSSKLMVTLLIVVRMFSGNYASCGLQTSHNGIGCCKWEATISLRETGRVGCWI